MTAVLQSRRVLAGALVVTLALRAPYLTAPLGIDEGGVALIAKAWGSGHGSIYGAYWLDRPPLLVAVYKLAVVAGPIGIRGLGAVAALALVVVCTNLARLVAGEAAARRTALLAAVVASSAALGAVFTPAELLAAVPAAGSVTCLVAAHRGRGWGWMAAAGLLAVSAALVKQSFLDAGLAGATFLVAGAVDNRRLALRRAAAYAAGALVPVAAVALWLLVAHLRPADLVYALAGFRVAALHTLAGSSRPPTVRVQELLTPALGSGIVVLLVAGLGGLWRLRAERVLVATLGAWLAGGAVGVLAGGSYWHHYLIQLAAPACVLGGVAAAGPRGRVPTVAFAAVATALTLSAAGPMRADEGQRAALATAAYIRAHASPGDTQWVMYARANVAYYTGLPSPYPYGWSLMVRAVPGARARLAALLSSPRRPTWIVGWQPPNTWHLDPHGALARAIAHHYRLVAHVRGHAIYRRRGSQ
jgi:hypothetical protein